MVFAVVVTAELLAMVLVLGSGAPASRMWSKLSQVSLYVQWIALCGAALLCLLGPTLRSLATATAGVVAWLVLLAVTGVVSELAYYVMGELEQYPLLDPDGHLGLTLKSLAVSAIVGALMLRYFYLHHLWRQQVIAESESRFEALQSRIRPHFLFNSMNTIASLTRTHPEVAEEVVNDLADLFRVSLGGAYRDSTLGDELDLARRYLNIEQLRLGERMRVQWEPGNLPSEALLPPLVIQPLLENAVYHGIEPSVKQGVIRVAGGYRGNRVKLTVRNTLPPPDNTARREGHRIALDNIRQRIAARFDGEAKLIESLVEDEYQVRLVFPHPWRVQ